MPTDRIAKLRAAQARRQGKLAAPPSPDPPASRPDARLEGNGPQKPARSKEDRSPRMVGSTFVGRFPVGTHFHNPTWDGSVWRTTLVVPGPDGNTLLPAATFSGAQQSIHRLLKNLAGQYGKWLESQKKTAPDGESGTV